MSESKTKRKISDEQRMEKFRENNFSVGDILDTSAEVLASMTAKGILDLKTTLVVPPIIIAILKECENKNKKKED